MSDSIVRDPKPKRAWLALRAVVAFLLLGALIVGVYLWGYRSYAAVAEWAHPGSHEALIYDGETYRCIGTIGKKGLNLKDYPIGEIIGRVRDDGTPVETEAPTLPPDAESGETVPPIPPNGDPTLAREHSYVLYSVDKRSDMLLLLESDGAYRLYYRESAAWLTPGDHTALTYEGCTFLRVGMLGTFDLSSKKYTEDAILGLVRNDGLRPAETDVVVSDDYADHNYIFKSVKKYSHLLILEEADGKSYLYFREGSANPLA